MLDRSLEYQLVGPHGAARRGNRTSLPITGALL